MVFYNCFCVPPATGGTQVTESTVVTTSTAHSIYAQWAAKQYIVTLDANGGNVTPSTITVTYNSTYESLPIPSRTNYDFDGWYTNRSGGNYISNNMTVITSTNHTLYALHADLHHDYSIHIHNYVDIHEFHSNRIHIQQ